MKMLDAVMCLFNSLPITPSKTKAVKKLGETREKVDSTGSRSRKSAREIIYWQHSLLDAFEMDKGQHFFGAYAKNSVKQ